MKALAVILAFTFLSCASGVQVTKDWSKDDFPQYDIQPAILIDLFENDCEYLGGAVDDYGTSLVFTECAESGCVALMYIISAGEVVGLSCEEGLEIYQSACIEEKLCEEYKPNVEGI